MNFKNLFLGVVGMAALTMTISSCSSDDAASNSVIQNDKVGMYMSLQLVGPQTTTGTRTMPGEDQTEKGTAVQNKISSLLVLLCDPTSHDVKESKLLKESDLVATTDGASTKVTLTHEGTYEVYAIANPTEEMKYEEGTQNLIGTTIENVTEAVMKSNYAADNTFIMFNQCNGTDEVKGAELKVTAANDYDNPARCSITLDRLAVQIRSNAETVTITDITTDNKFLTAVALQSFKLLNGAQKVNLQQKWSNATTDKGDAAPWFNLLQTPSLKEGTNTGGAEYYNHLTFFRTIAMDASKKYTTVKDLYTAVASYNDKGSIFCMENHPTNALLGNTTGLVYQFKATVSSSDKKAGENCFYGYNDKYFATLKDLQTAYPHAFDKATGNTDVDRLTAAEKELSDAYANTDNDAKQTAISNFRVKYNVKVYTDGIMYYTYFIKDKNYKNAAENGKTYYSVMRNTIYDLTVTELLRIGTDIPGGWTPDKDEPTDPVDPTNVYMVVTAKVSDWALSQENDIKLQ